MKAAVICHSVCGNTFLMSELFAKSFNDKGVDAKVYRVLDLDWKEQPDIPKVTSDIFQRMLALPIATPETILNTDIVVMGSPTYFGNVSAQMKVYMDSAAGYWIDAKLAGKKLGAFTSVGNPEGGGGFCLQAINTFGQFMGMQCVVVPTTLVKNINVPANGIIHYSYASYAQTLDENLVTIIVNFTDVLIKA